MRRLIYWYKPAVVDRSRHVILSAVLAFLLIVPALYAADGPAQAKPAPGSSQGLSRKLAEEFQDKVTELSSPSPASGKSLDKVVITDNEINSYLKYDPPPNMSPGVTDSELHFKPDGIHGEANVDFDRLQPPQQAGNDMGAKLLGVIFHGTQHVTALGKINSSDGTAKLTLSDVHIGNTVLSDWLVNWLLQSYIQSQYQIDLTKPFMLPDHVTRIDFAPGQAIFVRGEPNKRK